MLAIRRRDLGEEWNMVIRSHWWASAFDGDLSDHFPYPSDLAHATRLLALKDMLLGFGGSEVCLPAVDEDIDLYEKHGEVWLDKSLIVTPGRPNSCHENSLRLWEARPDDLVVATGYCLDTRYHMWRQHSWCLRRSQRGGRVVETTVRGSLYFGVPLLEDEARERCLDYI